MQRPNLLALTATVLIGILVAPVKPSHAGAVKHTANETVNRRDLLLVQGSTDTRGVAKLIQGKPVSKAASNQQIPVRNGGLAKPTTKKQVGSGNQPKSNQQKMVKSKPVARAVLFKPVCKDCFPTLQQLKDCYVDAASISIRLSDRTEFNLAIAFYAAGTGNYNPDADDNSCSLIMSNNKNESIELLIVFAGGTGGKLTNCIIGYKKITAYGIEGMRTKYEEKIKAFPSRYEDLESPGTGNSGSRDAIKKTERAVFRIKSPGPDCIVSFAQKKYGFKLATKLSTDNEGIIINPPIP